MAPIHELWYCVRNSPTKSGCKILNLPGNYPILNNKCHQQNIFTPLPSPNPTNPEISLFWPNGTVFSHFRSVLAATRPEKFIIFAGDIRFVAGRCLLLGIIPHCYIHSANNGRSTITHIWKSGGQGGVVIHQDRPPPDLQNLSVFAQRPAIPAILARKADRALQHTTIERLWSILESYPPKKSPEFGGQGGVAPTPPWPPNFGGLGLRRIRSGHTGAWDRS